jgi:hypothetical protein
MSSDKQTPITQYVVKHLDHKGRVVVTGRGSSEEEAEQAALIESARLLFEARQEHEALKAENELLRKELTDARLGRAHQLPEVVAAQSSRQQQPETSPPTTTLGEWLKDGFGCWFKDTGNRIAFIIGPSGSGRTNVCFNFLADSGSRYDSLAVFSNKSLDPICGMPVHSINVELLEAFTYDVEKSPANTNFKKAVVIDWPTSESNVVLAKVFELRINRLVKAGVSVFICSTFFVNFAWPLNPHVVAVCPGMSETDVDAIYARVNGSSNEGLYKDYWALSSPGSCVVLVNQTDKYHCCSRRGLGYKELTPIITGKFSSHGEKLDLF